VRTSASCCRSPARLSTLLPASGLLYLAALALTACATSSPRDEVYPYQSWVEFGSAVQSFAPAELDRAYARALSDHESMPDSESAVRLAILLASPNNPSQDLAGAIALLDTVSRGAPTRDANVEFVQFYRPLLAQLLESRETVDRVVGERAVLQSQLDALKDLEEQLNAVAPAR